MKQFFYILVFTLLTLSYFIGAYNDIGLAFTPACLLKWAFVISFYVAALETCKHIINK